MIIPVTPAERNLLVAFLSEVHHLKLNKKSLTLIAKLRDDFRRNQVNSQRFEHARPLLKILHTHCMNTVAQSLRYDRLPRWQRLLVLPAVLVFMFRVFPRRAQFYGRLALVAQALNSVHERIAKPAVPNVPEAPTSKG